MTEIKAPTPEQQDRGRDALMTLVSIELDAAYAKHGRDQWGRHEFYGVLKEEVDELWDAIKADKPQDEVLAELVQIIAVCTRYVETGDRYRRPLMPDPRSPIPPAEGGTP